MAEKEKHFGLFLADGTPKPSALAVHNLLSLLRDDGAASFTPGQLGYTLSGMPGTADDLLFQRSDGTFMLVLWDDANGWDPDSHQPVAHAAATILLKLEQTAVRVEVFDVLADSPEPAASYGQIRDVPLSLPDWPIVVSISPDLAPVC